MKPEDNTLISVVIIDDEIPAREIIRHYLQDYSGITIVGEADNGFDALKLLKEVQPQLIFLDVQMPKLTGFEVLELMENPPEVIFSTAFDEYAIRAFEANAIDYLLKPYSKQRFDAAIGKALAKIKAGSTNTTTNFQELSHAVNDAEGLLRIAVKNKQQIHVISIQEINYIEANGDYVNLHTEKGLFLKEKTMKYFEENLPRQQFVRIHRSYIVNVNEVAKIELCDKENYFVYLKNGKFLKASNSGYKSLKEAVNM